MDVGAVFVVIFGLIVFGWMFKAMFPKTYERINEWAGRLAGDDDSNESS